MSTKYYPKYTRPHWDRRNEKEGKGKKKEEGKKKGREGGSEGGRKREKYEKGKSTLFLYQPGEIVKHQGLISLLGVWIRLIIYSQ